MKPTRLAADAIQLPLARTFAEEANGVVRVPVALEDLALICLAEERVGDMKRGAAFLALFSLGGVSSRGWYPIEPAERRLPVLLAFAVMSDSFPIIDRRRLVVLTGH